MRGSLPRRDYSNLIPATGFLWVSQLKSVVPRSSLNLEVYFLPHKEEHVHPAPIFSTQTAGAEISTGVSEEGVGVGGDAVHSGPQSPPSRRKASNLLSQQVNS